jgi:hypothetical protein
VDEETAVVPEFAKHASAIIQPAPAPTYEAPLVAMDVGFADFHAILYGYWNFREAKLVVQAEDVLQRATTDRIAQAMKAKEATLWGANKGKTSPQRWSDVDLRLIADLWEMHKLSVTPTAKDDLEAQVNNVRLLVKDEKVIIDPACVTLIRQLRTGVWKDNRREFERTKSEGHFDALAAFVYFARNADRYTNPYPALPEGINDWTHHVPARLRNQPSDEAKALGAALRRKVG